MDQFLGFICIGVFASIVVAIVVRINRARAEAAAGRRGKACPRCHTPLDEHRDHCAVCDWPAIMPGGERSQRVYLAIQHQLDRYRSLGFLRDERHQEASAALRKTLTEAAATETTAVAEAAPQAIPDQHTLDQDEIAQDVQDVEVEEEVVFAETVDEPTVQEPVADHPVASSSEPEAAPDRIHQYFDQLTAQPSGTASPSKKGRQALVPFLAAFLEEKNIRWGELVGGLLIVCFSIALAISFWSEIADRPLLKFGLFNGVSAALFGVGFLTDRRWKIRTTSRGLLIISVLLVPLNFLAIAAFTDRAPPSDLLSLAGEGFSIVIFSGLTFAAARMLVPNASWLVALGVMVPSLMQLITRRFMGESAATGVAYGLASVPLGVYVGVAITALGRIRRSEEITEESIHRFFVLLGLVSYAVVLPLALLVYKSGEFLPTLQYLSPMITIFGAPALATGIWSWRRLSAPGLSGVQTAGMAVGVFGAIVMAAAVILAWPDPATLLPTTLMTATIFFAVAWRYEIPAAHLPGAACLMVAWPIGFHLFRGDLSWYLTDAEPMIDALFSAVTGNVLVPLVGVFLAVAASCKRAARHADAMWWAIGAALAAAVSLLLVTLFGFAREGDPYGVTWTYALFAVIAVAAAVQSGRRAIAWPASGLVLAACLQAILFRFAESLPLDAPWTAALLLHASMMTVAGIVVRRLLNDDRPVVALALVRSGLVTSFIAVVSFAAAADRLDWDVMSGYLLWIALVWLAISLELVSVQLFAGFQLALVAAMGCGVTAVLAGRAWYVEATYPWLDPWFLQAQSIALSIFAALWIGVRVALPWRGNIEHDSVETQRLGWPSAWRHLLHPAWSAVDRVCELAALSVFALLSIYSVLPGVAQELAVVSAEAAARVLPAVSAFEIPGMPHQHAAGRGAWILFVAVSVALLAGMKESRPVLRSLGVACVAALGCFLLATGWESDVSVASALRWLLTGYFLVASAAIAWRQAFARWGTRLGIATSGRDILPASGTFYAHAIVISIVAATYLAMAGYVAVAAIWKAGIAVNIEIQIVCFLGWLLLSMLAAASLELLGRNASLAVIRRATGNRISLLLATAGHHAVRALCVLGTAPLAIACVFAVAEALQAFPIVGAEPGTWFHTIGVPVSYGVPLVVIALAFVGHAIRERSSRYAFGACLSLCSLATLAVLIGFVDSERTLDALAWVQLIQLNSGLMFGGAVVWLIVLAWHRRLQGQAEMPLSVRALSSKTLPLLLVSQLVIATTLCVLPIAAGVCAVAIRPELLSWIPATGGVAAWATLILAMATLGTLAWRNGWTALLSSAGLVVAVLVSLVALSVSHADTGNWLSFHTLLVGYAVAACSFPVVCIGSVQRVMTKLPSQRTAERSSIALGIATVLLALRALDGDPGEPWWTLGALVAISGLSVAWARITLRRVFVWLGGSLALLATTIWWLDEGHRLTVATGTGGAVELLLVNVMAACAFSCLSVALERIRLRVQTGAVANDPLIGFHRVATVACIGGLLMVTALGLLADMDNNSLVVSGWLSGGALVVAIVAALARLWDPATRYNVQTLYMAGLVAAGMMLDRFDLHGEKFWWSFALVSASYVLLTGYLWAIRQGLLESLAQLGLPVASGEADHRTSGPVHGWLVVANGTLSTWVVVLVFWIVLTFANFGERITAAQAILAVALSAGCMVSGAMRRTLQNVALLCGVLFAIALGWACLPVAIEFPLLHRWVAALVAMMAMIPIYGFAFVKLWPRADDWPEAARGIIAPLTGTATALLLFVLGVEVYFFFALGRVPIEWAALVAVAAALVGVSASALAMALIPGRDPFRLSERGRTIYVYGAEVAMGLLFLHIRITMPWLFQGFFLQYWPLVVMAIAFTGVGFAEWCHRRRQTVLSVPLENTGALMPMLPVLGYWMVPNEVHYSLLLLAVGVLYSVLSVLRRSFLFSVLAALAANGGLWYLLSQADGLGLAEHPQIWIIPPAVCVLIAAHFNRSRLGEDKMTSIRYLATVVIYAASTGDIFLNGVAEAPWLPLVLGGLAIVGIFAGILLRVRAFLYLGVSFLLVSLFTVIWYAAVELERTWIWWVCGIVTGFLIIAFFGLFEKKRDEILKIVDRMQHWEA